MGAIVLPLNLYRNTALAKCEGIKFIKRRGYNN
jgi:hypothetical protein